MSMSLKNQQALLRDGFLQSEVTEFAEAVAPDGSPLRINIEAKVWLEMRENRRNWIRMLQKHCQEKLGRRLSQTDINALVTKFYSLPNRDPWTLLKAEYKPPKQLSDYAEARTKRARQGRNTLYRKRTTKTQKRSKNKQGFEE